MEIFKGTKKIVLYLGIILVLIGCTTHINQVKNKWGPPAEVKYLNDRIIYYYYFYQGRAGGLTDEVTSITIRAGWIVVEIITDKSGKIIGKRKYWKQPTLTNE